MVSQTNEQALEDCIEQALTSQAGSGQQNAEHSSQVGEADLLYAKADQYMSGNPVDFNARYAIDERLFWEFLEKTHEEELAKLKRYSDYRQKIIDRYDNIVKRYGQLYVYNNGLDVDDAHFDMMYPVPPVNSSKAVKENFESNIFSLTRQVHYNQDKPHESIDIVLFINGMPFASMELKNAWTGQTARLHGQQQYIHDRDTTQPLLQFGRCLVHFTLDTDEVYMTTRLAGKKTYFLPFNKGNNNGRGNPVNPAGHRTDYMWNEVLTRKSVANIIQHFVRLDGQMKDPLKKRTLFFPRYHQLDVVRQLVADVTTKGAGKTYLIQHSAGSGKSNSITWLAYQLIEVHEKSKSENPLFDSVVVVTDRRLLDKQLRTNIKSFSKVKNIVAPAYSSSDLRQSLEKGKKIIVTTIQKFPYIVEGINNLSDKKFAVVIDEAHSSQSGIAAWKMNQAMGQLDNDVEEPDAQDLILAAIKARKMKDNASYFAFTATPKNTTLERFGEQQSDGSFKPFHLYSMKQAIEEGFILDVLSNYSTYKSYYEIQKSIQENPLFESMKAQKMLKASVERNPETIASKAELMLEHLFENVLTTERLKGKAKAMVVTQSIESAINYYFAIKKILESKDNPFKILIAFSGKKTVRGNEYSEEKINGVSESKTREAFDQDDYRILVVANKYLTGFDQPKLCAMYVDKRFQGVQAVQALSRLNRTAPKLGKKTEDLFVLDFFNDESEIKAAFEPFYVSATLTGATDLNVLHELKELLDDVGVYDPDEVDEFNKRFFQNEDAQNLSPIIDAAAARFNDELEMEDKDKADYKIKAKQFVKIYGQMATIMPFEMPSWEKRFWFLKFLIPKLIVKDKEANDLHSLMEAVNLESYGIKRVKLGSNISLEDEESSVEPQTPRPRGVHEEPEKDPLYLIVRSFNEKWFDGWEATPEEQRVKFVKLAENIRKHPDFEVKYKQNPDPETKKLAFNKIFDDVITEERSRDLDFYRMLAKDEAFRESILNTVARVLDYAS
jgi:type I restriction enzyme, R subunit